MNREIHIVYNSGFKYGGPITVQIETLFDGRVPSRKIDTIYNGNAR